MKLKTTLLLTVATGVLYLFPAVIANAATSQPSAGTAIWPFSKKKQDIQSKDTTAKAGNYGKLTEQKKQIGKGMFTIYQDKNDYYFDIPQELFLKDMLIINKLQRVPSELNDAGVNRGVNYENQMVRFEADKKQGKLLVRQQRPLPHFPEGDAIGRSVKDNFISPLIAEFKIEAWNSDSTRCVVKVTDQYNGAETSFNNVFNLINLGTSANKSLSRILSMKAFENNIAVRSELTTKVNEGMSSVYVTVEVSSSLLLLPATPMMGRVDNPRIGYFTNSLQSFSDAQQRMQKKEYLTRWRLEPRAEDKQAYLSGQLVEPAKPIVFYIDQSTPRRWVPYMKKGIEDWNRAFERAGFKNAIRAYEIADSITAPDEDDVNYSVLTYAASAKANAMGPSVCDPRSGEILEADIMWWHNVLSMLQEWITVQTGTVNPAARGNQLPDSLMGDAMRFVACHEVGHSLGLRHNMMGSWAFPTDSLRSTEFTNRMNSTSSSIMDYARYNYVAQPEDGVTALTPNIGPYDLLAIEYGYRWYDAKTPEAEKSKLNELLTRHTGRLYKYSEAQDVRDAVDPRAQNEDLGDDPVKSSQLGVENLKRIMPQILKWTTTGEEGQTYEEASRLYYAVINQWNNYLYHVMANVGGIYLENTTVGDGIKTFTFVEREKQQAALDFLMKEVFANPEWLFGTELSHYTYLLKNTPLGVVENAPTQVLKNAQSYLFWDLLSNTRILRMLENEQMNGRQAFTAVEMMEKLHRHVFATTLKGTTPDVMTRSLQKGFVDALINAASEAQSNKDSKKAMDNNHFLLSTAAPRCSCDEHAHAERMGARRDVNFYGTQVSRTSDAISVKRGELLRIKELLQAKAKTTADRATQYHYKDLVLRINTALGTTN